jgi:hypothetical protein
LFVWQFTVSRNSGNTRPGSGEKIADNQFMEALFAHPGSILTFDDHDGVKREAFCNNLKLPVLFILPGHGKVGNPHWAINCIFAR